MLKSRKNKNYLPIIVLVIYFAFSLFPIYWMVITSIKTDAEVYTAKPTYFPKEPTFDNYVSIFTTRPYFRYTFNTVIISIGATLSCIAFGTIAAYGFSRYKFRFNKLLRYTFLGMRVFPPISLIVPFFMMIGWLRLYESI